LQQNHQQLTIIIFDTGLTLRRLYPICLTRPVSEVRHGLFTLRQWYALVSGLKVNAVSAPFFAGRNSETAPGPFLCIDSSVVPGTGLMEKLLALEVGNSLEDDNGIIGYVSDSIPSFDRFPLFFGKTETIETVARVLHPMDWVKTNAKKLVADFSLLNMQGLQQPDGSSNRIFGLHPVWMEEGAKASGVLFNTEEGPVYIGKNALVMEGVCIRGPVAILEGAVVKMGSQVYPGTTIGQSSVAGGEIKNSILGDYSNKAHHGYLGDSIIGRWCNLGAGTSNSNVKNTAGEINMWNESLKKMVPAGKKAGLVMGDYSKTAINTSLNTGTTVGACCSLHKAGFPDKHIPSFSWGPGEIYDFDKALQDLENWCRFKNQPVEDGLVAVLEHLWNSRKSS
jgi:UDP-N-acetylglucosamine diphosphorylase / glucose-1-phosphate thymidylyltransferase / UDP-N-acetylgalactosamine diphosphorylase / glucosamine-1-phosphate N-acetyltransferase / galactosamine-1-phosphate N-acetyltransferase